MRSTPPSPRPPESTGLHERSTRTSFETDHGVVEVVTTCSVTTRSEGPAETRFLLLHGNPGSMIDVEPLFAPLSDLGAVAAYDAPGFGRSPDPTSADALRLDAHADLAVRMLDWLEWPDVVLVGHSHGGGVAQRVAHRRPDRVRGLVLLGTLGSPAHFTYRVFPLPGVEAGLGVLGRLLPRLPRRVGLRLVESFMRGVYAPGPLTAECVEQEHALLSEHPHILRNMARLTKGSPCDLLERHAPDIAAPTLFVHGDEDAVVPIDRAKRLHQRMEHAGRCTRFVTLRGVGHMVAKHAPDHRVREIRALLAGESEP